MTPAADLTKRKGLPRGHEMLEGLLRNLQDWLVAAASAAIDKEIERRNALRGQHRYRWLTSDEAAVAAALAKLIVPSSEESPGLDDVDVLGPSAMEMLDKRLASSQYSQTAYARGLLGFDLWAFRTHGAKFAELKTEAQLALFAASEKYFNALAIGPAPLRAWRKIVGILRAGDGTYFAARLFPGIRSDCLQIFYTSRVGWMWLEYDGPPMDEGYPRLAPRRR